MSRDIKWSRNSWNECLAWYKKDQATFDRIIALIESIRRTPFEGIGKPEPLRGDLTGTWSRRINNKDRLVYFLQDNDVVIIACKGHYGDK